MDTSLNASLTIRSTTLKNRIVLAPMGVGHCVGGVPDAELRSFYRRRAQNGVGLIITCATFIDHQSASNHLLLPSIAGREAQQSWASVVRDVHDAGSAIILQLEHSGVDRNPNMSLVPSAPTISPSGVDHAGKIYGTKMVVDDIDSVIDAFARSAQVAEQLGFDGIELHGAHGFLIDQFFWDITNFRKDKYGQPSRFAVEVVEAVRSRTSPDFIISFRWSQWKMHDYNASVVRSASELEELLSPISQAGVDIFHASTRRWWKPLFSDSPLTAAAWTKIATGKPTIAVGCVGSSETIFHTVFEGKGAGVAPLIGVEAALKRADFDLVAVGRPLLGDHQWAFKVLSGNQSELKDFKAEALFDLY